MAADTSDPAIAAAIADVKNTNSATSWVLLTYEKQTTKLKVASTGDGNLDELKEELNDGKIFFGFIRFNIGGVWKFVYVSWCGEGVVGMMKGRFNNHCKDLERFLTGFHVQINARVETDLEENAIKAKLSKAQGANYDAGQKIQGTKKGGVTSVAEGHEKVLKPKEKKITKIDDGKVGIDKKDQFWDKQNKEDEARKPQYKPQRNDPNYNLTDQRTKYWQDNPESSNTAPQRSDFNKKKESDEYWSKVNAEDEAQKAQQANKSTQVAGSSTGARNIKNQFEAAPVSRPPPPGKGKPAPPPAQVYEEPVHEEPAYEEHHHEEQVYEEAVQHEEHHEEHHHEEQVYEEVQQIEEQIQEQVGQEYQTATALYDYAGEADGDLSFGAGEIITIHDTSDPGGWWQGELNGVIGVFPSNFVQLN